MGLNTINKNSQASAFLDVMRFVAAFFVVVHHVSLVVPVPYHTQTSSPILKTAGWLLYEICQTGYPFVMVFFVLSGYFISGSVLNMLQKDRWSWKTYLTNRVTRLWVVLLPALILSYIWKLMQFHFFGPETGYSTSMDWKTFLGNLFFLQNIATPIYAHNGPLWSLNYEFWYYILFPCLILIFKSKSAGAKGLYLLISLLIMKLVGVHVLEYFLIWLMGVGPVFLKPRHTSRTKGLTTGLIVSLVVFAVSLRAFYLPQLHLTMYYADLIVGLLGMVVVSLVIARLNGTTSHPTLLKWSAGLSGFSYSLYLVHYPVIDFVEKWFHSGKWHVPVVKWYSVDGLLILILLGYSWGIGKLTEDHTGRIRNFVLAQFRSSHRAKKEVIAREVKL